MHRSSVHFTPSLQSTAVVHLVGGASLSASVSVSSNPPSLGMASSPMPERPQPASAVTPAMTKVNARAREAETERGRGDDDVDMEEPPKRRADEPTSGTDGSRWRASAGQRGPRCACHP